MSKGNTDIVIVIPYFNTGRYVKDMRASLARQGNVEMRIILIDDGSSDDTLSALEAWAQDDPRVSVLSQENQGQSAARNLGLEHIAAMEERPRYLMFIDSDDELESGALAALIADAEARDLDILEYAGNAFYETEDLHERFSSYDGYYINNKPTELVGTGMEYLTSCVQRGDFTASPCMKLFRTDLLIDNAVRFYEGIIHEDNLFSIECMLCAERVSYCPTPYYRRRIRPGSTVTTKPSWKNIEGYLRCVLEIQAILDERPGMDEHCAWALRTLMDGFLDNIRFNPALGDQDVRQRYFERWTSDERVFFEEYVDGGRRMSDGEVAIERQDGHQAGLLRNARRFLGCVRRRFGR